MLRRAGQLTTHADEVEQLGAIHSIVREYRRRIINVELSHYQAARPNLAVSFGMSGIHQLSKRPTV